MRQLGDLGVSYGFTSACSWYIRPGEPVGRWTVESSPSEYPPKVITWKGSWSVDGLERDIYTYGQAREERGDYQLRRSPKGLEGFWAWTAI